MMTVDMKKEDTTLYVTVEGSLGTPDSPDFLEMLKPELPGVEELIIDFAGLEYLSSSGLRALLLTSQIMAKQGSMKVINSNETVRNVFSVTGFQDILNLE